MSLLSPHMRIKRRIMPYIAKGIGGKLAQTIQHKSAEIESKLRGNWPMIEVYLQVGDPYSQLLLEYLAHHFADDISSSRNDVNKLNITIRWIVDKEQDMFPEPVMLQKYARQDAHYLADKFGLEPPIELPLTASHQRTLSFYLETITKRPYTTQDNMEVLLKALHHFTLNPTLIPDLGNKLAYAKRSCDYNAMNLINRGHYNSAMLYFAGDWYWGLDRLSYLSARLGISNRQTQSTELKTDEQAYAKRTSLQVDDAGSSPIILYWSARSPYSYLALMRLINIGRKYKRRIEIKPVLPMVMRGVHVPKRKKMYIFRDTLRESQKHKIPYGFVADPLGTAVENCYALLDYARSQGRYIEFLVSFSKAVNAQGIHADNESGMYQIVKTAGLDWQIAKQHLHNNRWRIEVDANLKEMYSLGVWGVPSIQFENIVVWGQDRLDRIEEAIINDPR